MKRRVGIFGGTFNPPHIGHVEAAKSFADAMRLDQLIIMPNYVPPHKTCDLKVSCDDRLEMCRIAFKEISCAEVSDLEIARGGTSYTYLTLQALSSEDTDLYFLCGTDMILTMDTWKNPDVIFSLAKICYIRREKNEEISSLLVKKSKEYKDTFGAEIYRIDSDIVEISSSEIRGGETLRMDFLPQKVAEYIKAKGLYE